MKLNTLEQALLEELKDIYDSEHQIVGALPKMAQEASDPDLKAAFKEHLEQTKEHIARLEHAFELLGEKPERETCEATKGLLKEGKHVMAENAAPEVMDAFLIAAAQKVEHYEIASYGTVCTWARTIGRDDVKEVLGQTLAEEESTDDKLTSLAERTINLQAV
jgi:ferritin-like metal-binding protein YciE